MRKKCISILLLLTLLMGCGAQSKSQNGDDAQSESQTGGSEKSESQTDDSEFSWLEQGIPDGYEQVWEDEKDGILIELYNPKDDSPSMLRVTNNNDMDAKVYVNCNGEAIDGGNYRIIFHSPGKLCPGKSYTEMSFTQYVPETISCEQETPYYSLQEDDDKTLKNGVSLEVMGWSDEWQEVEYNVKNNTDKPVYNVVAHWIWIKDGVVVDEFHSNVVTTPEEMAPGEETKHTLMPFEGFDKEKDQIIISYTYE